MPGPLTFTSPLSNPGSWTVESGGLSVPAGFRYAGYRVRALRATHSAGRDVVAPAQGMVRTKTTGAGAIAASWVELQLNPFAIRPVAHAFPFGLPTFYFRFGDAAGAAVADGDGAGKGQVLRAGAKEVMVALVGQDRVAIDPSLWAAQVQSAIAQGGHDVADWQPFASQIKNQIGDSEKAPVIVLDAAGQLVPEAQITLQPAGGKAFPVELEEGDGGDLQWAVHRAYANDATLPQWIFEQPAPPSVRLTPIGKSPPNDFQLVRVEDGFQATTEIDVTRTARHVAFTDLMKLFASQVAVPTGASAPRLARYSRGNKVGTFVNGPEFYRALFGLVTAAAGPGARFDLAGWSIDPTTRLAALTGSDPDTSLEQVATTMGAAGGSSRFLPAALYNLPSGTTLPISEVIAVLVLIDLLLLLEAADAARTDEAGLVVLAAVVIGAFLAYPLVRQLFESGGEPIEQNKPALDRLHNPTNDPSKPAQSRALLSRYPAVIADNTAFPPPQNRFPFGVIFNVMQRFGVHHHKFALVRDSNMAWTGFCGGIDVWPDRLDDERHLLRPKPFHDVHASVRGPAARDLAMSFEERWAHETSSAFSAPPASEFASAGDDVVQIARTYFKPASGGSNGFEFAPQGDRTLFDTVLNAIDSASEFIYIEDQYLTPPSAYRNRLLNKVKSGDLRKLVIVVPGLADQPFGEIIRSGFVADLRAAAPDVVHVGYPRAGFAAADNDLRAASGKCRLAESLAEPGSTGAGGSVAPASIVLEPEARVPTPPFWVAVGGELVWCYDEAPSALWPPGAKRLLCERGEDTGLVRVGGAQEGPRPREHDEGTAATVIELPSVYVHAKMMIVDDVFLSVGSANLNRRGFLHDGELNIFCLPQGLKTSPRNPVAPLRRRLWAEMLDLPYPMCEPLLRDPLAATALFERSPFAGNRFADLEAYPTHLMAGATTGDGIVTTLLQLAFAGLTISSHADLFDAVIDPASGL
jgi:phosphatidylserine/phosphatidylglycerophosphate/cardiolipin synthase-like enzyme